MRGLTMGLTISAVLAAASPAFADPPIGIAAAMGFPPSIQMFAGGDVDTTRTQDQATSYELTNLGNQPITLTANSDCEAHAWRVTDASGTVVDSAGPCPPGGQPVTAVVAPGKPVDGTSTVTLHVFDYKEGQTYTIHYATFGAEATSDFTVSLLK
jgi:hypothetical protein